METGTTSFAAESAKGPITMKNIILPAGWYQTPPDVKIRIRRGTDVLLKIISVGALARGTKYAKHMEYWRHASAADFDADALTMECVDLDETTEQAVDDYLDDVTGGGFSHVRPAEEEDWHEGEREIPEGRVGYLFSATDPDDEERRIGVLIELDDVTGELVSTAWYKTTLPSNGQIWSAETPLTLTLQRVKDGTTPTTDPTHIPSSQGQTWYWTSMGAP